MTPEEILDTLKTVFTTFSESSKFLRSRKCGKIVEGLLKQFGELIQKIDSFTQDKMEKFLNTLNGIIQTINAVIASSICH